MRAAIAVGLIALGILGLAYGGFSYWHRESVVDIGPIHASAERKETVPISPIAGAVALAAGCVLLFTNNRT